MATPKQTEEPVVAHVDHLVDETGAKVALPAGTPIKVAGEHDATVGATGPTNWWLYGLGALAIIVAILLVMQIFSGAPGTDMQAGTPTSQPVVETPAAPAVDAPAVDAPAE